MIKQEKVAYCDFCGKSQHEVELMIGGPATIMVCDECVALCNDIIAEARAKKAEERSS